MKSSKRIFKTFRRLASVILATIAGLLILSGCNTEAWFGDGKLTKDKKDQCHPEGLPVDDFFGSLDELIQNGDVMIARRELDEDFRNPGSRPNPKIEGKWTTKGGTNGNFNGKELSGSFELRASESNPNLNIIVDILDVRGNILDYSGGSIIGSIFKEQFIEGGNEKVVIYLELNLMLGDDDTKRARIVEILWFRLDRGGNFDDSDDKLLDFNKITVVLGVSNRCIGLEMGKKSILKSTSPATFVRASQ
ncbi:MAG: hypothetical protein HY717_02475 [Planctomycetes bacterium]|nr:hypothetical protein [Planctomycetota bacterium]